MQDVYDHVSQHKELDYVFLRTPEITGHGVANPAVNFYEKQGFRRLPRPENSESNRIYFIKKIIDVIDVAEDFTGRLKETSETIQ